MGLFLLSGSEPEREPHEVKIAAEERSRRDLIMRFMNV